MIDTEKEELLTLGEAAKTLPLVDGRKVSTATIWRWCAKGLGPDRVKLVHVRLGRRLLTTREALGRFMQVSADDAVARLEVPYAPPRPKEPRSRSAKQRERDIAAAEAVLRESGI